MYKTYDILHWVMTSSTIPNQDPALHTGERPSLDDLVRLVPLLGDRDVTGIKGCVPLKNWINVLNTAHDLLTNLSKTSEGQLAAHPLQKGDDITKSLLESLISLQAEGRADKILCNVYAAAMEIRVLLDVRFPYSFVFYLIKWVDRVAGNWTSGSLL